MSEQGMMVEKTGYEVEDKVVTNLKDVAKELGVTKVNRKDIEEGGKYSDKVAVVSLDTEAQEDIENMSDEEWEESAPKVEPEEEEINLGPDIDKDEEYTSLADEDFKDLKDVDVSEIESSFPPFEDLQEVKDFIKDLDTPTLEYLVRGMGLSWKPTYHPNIHRMRVAMALQKHFFPKEFEPKEKKKESKYGDYSTEWLFDMAEKEGIEYKKTGNDPIDRMRVIQKLKSANAISE